MGMAGPTPSYTPVVRCSHAVTAQAARSRTSATCMTSAGSPGASTSPPAGQPARPVARTDRSGPPARRSARAGSPSPTRRRRARSARRPPSSGRTPPGSSLRSTSSSIASTQRQRRGRAAGRRVVGVHVDRRDEDPVRVGVRRHRVRAPTTGAGPRRRPRRTPPRSRQRLGPVHGDQPSALGDRAGRPACRAGHLVPAAPPRRPPPPSTGRPSHPAPGVACAHLTRSDRPRDNLSVPAISAQQNAASASGALGRGRAEQPVLEERPVDVGLVDQPVEVLVAGRVGLGVAGRPVRAPPARTRRRRSACAARATSARGRSRRCPRRTASGRRPRAGPAFARSSGSNDA